MQQESSRPGTYGRQLKETRYGANDDEKRNAAKVKSYFSFLGVHMANIPI